MDNQDHGRNHSSGHESHGFHLCHKCGWPFLNPHPSAKHRRAHKKICGAIEGYKLVVSGDITHSTASDEEPLSDEDHKTPIAQVPKVMESSCLEKSIGVIGAMSNRSEDEVFSDAATEFQDSLDNASKADKIAEKDLTATISFKDCEDTDILQPAQNSADRSEKENTVLKSMPILSMGTPEQQDVGLSYPQDRNGSASDMIPIKTEPVMDVSEESRKVRGGDKVAECSVGQETDANENEVGNLNENLSGGLILPNEHAGEISETVSMSGKRLDVTSDMVLTDDMVQLEEEFSDRLASKSSISENIEQETDGKGNLGKTEDITSETGLADEIVEFKENGDKLALNMVINDLSPKAESAKDIESATCFNSNEVYDKNEKENESVYVLSVPDDIPVVEKAEIKVEGFKDHNTVKLSQLEALASEEIIVDKEEDEVRDRVSQEKSDTFPSNQVDEDNKADTSCIHVAEDSYKLGGNNEAIVKEELVEGKADVLQLNKGSDALGPFVDADTTENKKGQKVCSLEEKQQVYVSDEVHQTGFYGSMINVVPNVNPLVSHADVEARKLNNVVGSDDMGIPETARTGVFDIAGDDNTRRIDDENYVKNTVTSNESTNVSSLSSQTNPASNLLEVKNSTTESPVVTEEGNNEYVRTFPETEGPHLNRVSNSLDDIKESEISRDNKEQGECAGEDLMASAVDNSGGNEFERTSPSYAEPTSQNSGAVDDSHTRESGVDASGTSTFSLQGEADNFSIKPKLDTMVGDVSKSSSQTDSLEGQWGSVSVLSTQSDNPAAIIDTENFPSTGSHGILEAEKANIKKPKVASGDQHLVKSDEFEPPSFMTLVEPGGCDHPRAAPLQADVANESQGRKKNEEIIAKVTNWNAKQHIPPKSLLGEAISETKPKSPNSKENPAVVIPPREEKVAKVSSILGPEIPVAEPTNMKAVSEWNSPVRYPADIKREKRKVKGKGKGKGKPLWVQFVCCSSVN